MSILEDIQTALLFIGLIIGSVLLFVAVLALVFSIVLGPFVIIAYAAIEIAKMFT